MVWFANLKDTLYTEMGSSLQILTEIELPTMPASYPNVLIDCTISNFNCVLFHLWSRFPKNPLNKSA